MIVLVQATVLTVGLGSKSKALRELPIRLIKLQSANEAARSLKTEQVDSVVSNWELVDMPDGLFLQRLRAVKPGIPAIVFIRSGDEQQEIGARGLGVSAVLTDDCDDGFFRQTVANVLSLERLVSLREMSTHQDKSKGVGTATDPRR